MITYSQKLYSIPNGYYPYANILAYLKEKSSAFPYSGFKMNQERSRIMQSLGMNDFDTFNRCRMEWDILEGKIPIKYLQEIGVDLDILMFFNELDIRAYENLLLRKRTFTKAFGESKYSGSELHLGGALSDYEAIDYVNNLIKTRHKKYFTTAHIFLEKIVCHDFHFNQGYTGTTVYYPRLIFDNDHLWKSEQQQLSLDEFKAIVKIPDQI